MKRQFLAITLIIFTLALQACSSSPSHIDKINGVWKFDLETTVSEFKKTGKTVSADEVSEQAREVLEKGMLKDITLTIDSSKKELLIEMGEVEELMTFEVVSEKDNTFTLRMEDVDTTVALGKNSKGEETLSMHIPGIVGAQNLFFVKAK